MIQYYAPVRLVRGTFAVYCIVRKISVSDNWWQKCSSRVIITESVCVINSFISAVVCSIIADVCRRDSVEDCSQGRKIVITIQGKNLQADN